MSDAKARHSTDDQTVAPNASADADRNLSSTDATDAEREHEKLLQLQMAMQRENQVFTSVSNVLKTKHDTAKNSVGNIK